MSADIEKLAVFDARIVQSRPRFAVDKGALSLTNAPFSAISATPSQHTYNIYVPSENVFVDRKLQWSSTVFMTASLSLASAPAVGDSLVVPGRDFALCALPLNQLCSTISATINDTTSVINSQDVLREVLRLADYKKNRMVRSAPSMLDKYQSYDDAFGTLNNPLGGYDASTAPDEVQNGAYPLLQFTDPNGNPLASATPAYAGAPYNSLNGVPTASGVGLGPFPIYFRWRTTEPVCVSPFIFADTHEWDTGLFGINNIQLIMNLIPTPSRIIRQTFRAGRALSAVAYNPSVAQAFRDSVVNVQFLTPSLDVPLPPKSVVPYMEFPRYITQYNQSAIPSGGTGEIVSQTITLPCIPDMLIIYAKPSAYADNQGDWYFPLATALDGVRNPLRINFDNFSGLLSSHTTEELYDMSVHNGMEMDYATFIGSGHSAGGSYPGNQQGQTVPLVGSVLVLRPGVDITLQSGQAPSLVGNFTLQFNMVVKNTSSVSQIPQLFVVTANSGFFESIRGSSRIIKGVLSEQDIISAPVAPEMTRESLQRAVGAGGGFFGNMLSKIKAMASNPYVQGAVKGAVSGAMEHHKKKGGDGGTGGAQSGAGGLSRRLM
jgi:hypothetical protein